MEVEDRRSKIDTFLAVTETADAAAAQAMLEGNGWNVEGAIDFFFATGSTGAFESGRDGSGGHESGIIDHPMPIAGADDEEFERAIAFSMEDREARGGVQHHRAAPGAFPAPPFLPPPALPQFRPPSAPIPAHLRATGNISDPDDFTPANFGLPHGMGMRMGRGGDGGGSGGVRGEEGDDGDADQALLEAALKASLDAAQPAMDDEDDPLLAEALAESLRGEDGGVETASDSRSLMERFPALRAQLEAEERAAGGGGDGSGGGGYDRVAADAALAASLAAEAADLDDAGFAGGRGGGGGMWNAGAAASPRTLEARRVREEQDAAYEESLEMDRIREASARQAEVEERQREQAARAMSQAAAQAQQDAASKAAAEITEMRQRLGAEPAAGEGVVNIVVRLCDGSRLPARRFRDTDKVGDVYAYVRIGMHDKEGGAGGGGRPFQLVCSMLRSKIFQDKTQTLAEAELQGQTLLIAQPIE